MAMSGLNENQKEQIKRTVSELSLSSTRIHILSTKVEPFELGKFLNIVGKEISQIASELEIFAGRIRDDVYWPFPNLPSQLILQRIKEIRKEMGQR